MEKGDSNRFYAEVEKVGLPTVHITVVVYHEGLLLTQCGVGPPVDRETGDTQQTVFIGELLISFLEILIKSHMTVQTCDT